MLIGLPMFTLVHVVISGLVVVTAVTALYLNVFVLVVQLFARTPPLLQLAPTQQEPPFAVTQALVLALFAWLGWGAVRGFRTPNSVA